MLGTSRSHDSPYSGITGTGRVSACNIDRSDRREDLARRVFALRELAMSLVIRRMGPWSGGTAHRNAAIKTGSLLAEYMAIPTLAEAWDSRLPPGDSVKLA